MRLKQTKTRKKGNNINPIERVAAGAYGLLMNNVLFSTVYNVRKTHPGIEEFNSRMWQPFWNDEDPESVLMSELKAAIVPKG